MKPRLADLDADNRLLGELVASLATWDVANAASESTRRPRFRVAYPVHVPSLERDRRKSLPADAPCCPLCAERCSEIVSGKTCPNCLGVW